MRYLLNTNVLVSAALYPQGTAGRAYDPIVRAARAAGVHVIVTGDKDLVDAGLDHPVIQTPAQFLATRP